MTKPLARPITGALLVLSLSACASARKTEPVVTPPPVEAKVPEDPAAALHRAALAEVARLRAEADRDPLLAPWSGPYGGVPPWNEVKVERFPAAFEKSLALLLAEARAVATSTEPPTFKNVLVPLEDAGRHQNRAEVLFSVLNNNLSTPEVQKMDREWSPKIAAAYDQITFDPELFARISAVWAARETAGLTPTEKRLVERTYEQYVRGGAKLTKEGKDRLGQINQELAVLFSDFSAKVLADENTWVALDSKKDLEGLSDSLVAAALRAAKERNLGDGKWAIVNTRSSVDPFLAASTRRDLREKVWKIFKSRGDNGGEHDTNQTIAKIVKLRAERAKLLGYASHAAWRMADTMAVDPQKAKDLMMRVWPAAVARVKEEVADMQAVAKKSGQKITIEPWDYLFYAEKVRKAKYALDENELKPYFQLENMIAGAFWMAERLYGLHFTEITGQVPTFHSDVRVWEVKSKDGAFVGLFYGDYFARPGKRSGAWASTYQSHETFTGKVVTVITSNNNNFVRGGAGEPVLISLDDAETLFHEFGHALHSLLSEVEYPGLASTPRDFVEYPSQVHEQWVLARPILDRFAKHVKTGQPMPAALVEKVERSSKFNTGYGTVEYLSAAILDMELHTIADGVVDPKSFEKDTLQKIGAPREVAMRHRLPQFNHLFTSDSYSAGYYSYLWSEVMDADTRKAFAEAGDVFDPKVADKLRRFILAPGNSTDRAEAYRQFRGRDPDVAALLEKRGFPVK